MHTKVWLSAIILLVLLASCNLPSGETSPTQPPEVQLVSDVDAVGASVDLTVAAKMTEMAGSAGPLTATFIPSPTPTLTATLIPTPTPTPIQCNPSVTATVNANVRSGPDTAYDIVGALLLGASAPIAGRNDANTWWYVDDPGLSGGHGWIAASVVTTSCLPPAVQVVAAPPLPPTKVPTAVPMQPSRVPTVVLMRPSRVPTSVLWRPTMVPTTVPSNP